MTFLHLGRTNFTCTYQVLIQEWCAQVARSCASPKNSTPARCEQIVAENGAPPKISPLVEVHSQLFRSYPGLKDTHISFSVARALLRPFLHGAFILFHALEAWFLFLFPLLWTHLFTENIIFKLNTILERRCNKQTLKSIVVWNRMQRWNAGPEGWGSWWSSCQGRAADFGMLSAQVHIYLGVKFATSLV